MTAPIFVPRSTWYSGVPVNNDGVTPRSKLPKPVAGGLAVHYTGAPIRARNSTDRAEVYMSWMQASAFAQKKSFEYNDICPPRSDGTSQIWEYAGEYMAAHAGSINNMSWYAIQVAIGVSNHPSYASFDPTKPTVWEPLTDAMVNAIRWRRHNLVESGILAPNHEMRPHRALPTAQTICPGNAVLARWNDLLVPWSPTPQPPEDDMEYVTLTELPAALYLRTDNSIRWISPDVWTAIGNPIPTRVLSAAEAKALILVGPSPDGASVFSKQVA